MRGRSHRFQSVDPHDDWVDGSWTVDCVCGVTFDDGEEMVNCDECGVWVHTRCSKYVKGEESFACDKCKNKNNRNSSHNDSEETEVAQLLVELPTKTVRLESSFSGPARKPVSLLTNIPMENRVHVQGIPGGDPGLFTGLSSVFTPELWKCTGYVPKKLNFQYKEFPCWDEKEGGDKKEEENDNDKENPVDKGAGVLFYLSKESLLGTPVAALDGMRGRDEEGGFERKVYSKEMKKWDGEGIDVRLSQNGMKKERSLLRPVVIPSGNRKKDFGMSKDRSGKKKLRDSEKVADERKKGILASRTDGMILFAIILMICICTQCSHMIFLLLCKMIFSSGGFLLLLWTNVKGKSHLAVADIHMLTLSFVFASFVLLVFRPSSDAKHLEFYVDRGPKTSKSDIQNMKNNNLPEDVHQESISDGHLSVLNGVDKPKNDLAANERPLDAFSSDTSRPNFSNVDGLEQEMAGRQMPGATMSSPTTDDVSGSMLEHNDTRSIPVKQEGENMTIDTMDDSMRASTKSVAKPLAEDVASAVPEILDYQIPKDSSAHMSWTSVLPNVEVKTEVDNENYRGHLNDQSPSGDPKLQSKSCNDMAKISKLNELVASSLQSNDYKVQDAKRTSEAVTDCHTGKVHESTVDPFLIKREQEGSDGSAEVQKISYEFKQSEIAEEHSKAEGTCLNTPALTSQHKMVVCVGKSSSSSSVPKSSAPENLKSADARNSYPNNKQRVMPDSNASIKKDRDVSDVVRDEEKHDMSRKAVREQSKSSVNYVSKVLHSSRISHASVSKRTMSDEKDYVSSSSSKLSSVQNVAVTSGSGESARSLQSQCTLLAQSKMSTSTLPLKGEKLNQSNFQQPPKVNHGSSMHPPAASSSPAALSDEELALLLHQELNSSPRVPRVPRVRHTGNLPQLSSPTATSMLIKRTSSSGGKDHCWVSGRKNKDASRDGFHSRKLDDGSRKTGRVSSPDLRRQDIGYIADAYTRREDNGSPTAVYSMKKNMPSASTTTANSGPSSSAEVNDHTVSSVRNSPRNISDDDTGTNRGPVHRTLPVLIDAIMSKGRRMTYEELCNAVLPHWPHLRKHNGERYAYSSHSQAVLDCLRNRRGWARLVDRGPKTSSSRKRRKLDADESEDNEYGNGGTARELENKGIESQREDFPKGKRKARKRRHLALQGRGIKNVRKRQKVDVPSDDDVSLFSNSSEESMFSDDETQGGGMGAGGEASASSDEIGTS